MYINLRAHRNQNMHIHICTAAHVYVQYVHYETRSMAIDPLSVLGSPAGQSHAWHGRHAGRGRGVTQITGRPVTACSMHIAAMFIYDLSRPVHACYHCSTWWRTGGPATHERTTSAVTGSSQQVLPATYDDGTAWSSMQRARPVLLF